MSQPTENPRERSVHPGTRDRGEAEHFDQTPYGAQEERPKPDAGSAEFSAAPTARRTREKGN